MSNLEQTLTIMVDPNGIWHWGWYLGIFILLALQTGETALTVTFLYFVERALENALSPNNHFGLALRSFQATGAEALLEMVVVYYFARWVVTSQRRDRRVKYWVRALVVVEIALIWYQRAGLMGWESFDCALIAYAVPFGVFGPWLFFGVLATVLTHHATAAVIILFTHYLTGNRSWKIIAAWAPVFIGAIVYHAHGHWDWLYGSDRLHAWARYFYEWIHFGDGTFFLGTGGGSFQWLSMLTDDFKGPLFLCMHNDWLQILYEQGVLGLMCAIGTFLYACQRARGNPRLFSAVVTAGVFGLFWHPLRFFPSAVLITIAFTRAFLYLPKNEAK